MTYYALGQQESLPLYKEETHKNVFGAVLYNPNTRTEYRILRLTGPKGFTHGDRNYNSVSQSTAKTLEEVYSLANSAVLADAHDVLNKEYYEEPDLIVLFDRKSRKLTDSSFEFYGPVRL